MFRHRIKDLITLNAGVAILFTFVIALSRLISPPLVSIVVAVPVVTMIVIGSVVWVDADLHRKKMQDIVRRGDGRPLAWLQAYLTRKTQASRNRWRNPEEPSPRCLP